MWLFKPMGKRLEQAIAVEERDVPELVRGVPAGLELGLRNFWYPVIQSHELGSDVPVAITCLGDELVLFRNALGAPCVLFDRCPHRYVKLSSGRVMEGDLQCALHGLRFNGQGDCTLVPWEPESTDTQRKRACARSYPSAEIGGYVWAYFAGEGADALPPFPIETCVPEELLHPESFVHFSLETEEWDANWLLIIDGGDAYHAVTLHMESQHHDAVANYLDVDVAGDGNGTAGKKVIVPMANRRVKIVETEGHGLRGISVDLEGNLLDHGHGLGVVHGERFNLPGLVSNVLQPVANAAPYVSRMFQVPIDYRRTRIFRFAAWRATAPEQREHLKRHFESVVKPRQIKTAVEDKAIAAVSGDLVESRENEVLFGPDRDMLRVRRRMAAAFIAQRQRGRRVPEDETTPSRSSLVFPV